MARTIEEIHNEMLLQIAENESLSAVLNSDSVYSIYRLFSYIVAVAIWNFQNINDQHKKEVQDIILEKTPGTPRWYKSMALAFQYGFDLIPDTDKYNNTGATQAEIQESKIIKYAAVVNTTSGTNIKIATETAGELSPISDDQKEAFTAYIEEINYCGVNYVIQNLPPDILLLNLIVGRDALVINDSGMNIRTGIRTVEIAINDYMKELPFNGELILNHLLNKIESVDGVMWVHLVNAQSQVWNGGSESYDFAQPINIKTIPNSGYFKPLNFDNVSYVV